jgi:uncharacterized protein DUF6263
MLHRLLAALTLLLAILPAPAQDAKSVSLILQFPAGRSDRMVTTQDLRQTLTSDALPAPINQVQKQTMETVLRVGEGRSIDVTFERIRSSDNFRGAEVTYDSDKDKDSEDPSARVLNALIGAKLQMRFGADSKVEQFSGMNDVLDQLAKKHPAQAAMIGQLKQGLGDDAYKEMMTGFLSGFLPGKPVSPGDTWSATQSQKLAGLGSIQLKLNYKLDAVEERDGRKLAKISFDGKGTLEGNFGLKGAQIKADDVEQKGVIYFDLDRGWLADQKYDQTMKGTVSVTSPEGKEIRIAVEQKATFEVRVIAAK